MYSQNCSFLPSKKQKSFTSSLPQNLGMLRNFTSKSFPEHNNSSTHLGLEINFDGNTPLSGNNQNNFTSRSNSIMDFVCTLGDTSRMKFRNSASNFSIQSEKPRHQCQEIIGIAHYANVSTMPLVSSHLVGGFVGSKSQIGRRPTHGFGVKMWDIIRELVDLVGSSSNNPIKQDSLRTSSCEKKCLVTSKTNDKQNFQEISHSDIRTVENKPEEGRSYPKQSYADVAKMKLPSMAGSSSASVIDKNSCQNMLNMKCSIDCNTAKSVIEPPSSYSKYSTDRDRITSECSADSEDSFIVFEYCDEDEKLSNDEEDSSSDDESVLSLHANECSPSDNSTVLSRRSGSRKSCKTPTKKVRFAEGKSLTQVHPMVTWDFAYRSARRGPWEMLARDCERFRSRISNTEAILKPVLDPHHRDAVYHQRFSLPASVNES